MIFLCILVTDYHHRRPPYGPGGGHCQEAEDAGFDEHYFRRRPKSFCIPGAPPPHPGFNPMIGHHLGGAFQGTAYGGRYPGEGLHLSMGSLLEEQQQQQHMGTMVSEHC